VSKDLNAIDETKDQAIEEDDFLGE